MNIQTFLSILVMVSEDNNTSCDNVRAICNACETDTASLKQFILLGNYDIESLSCLLREHEYGMSVFNLIDLIPQIYNL